eukprot:CAMPEP_0174284000 /NCGR_PEP_ID=MMETSP0809-20121228/4709_1 /TAXON_ID=73025 ORGANISM="Eutreptiella gymnastica-like, Strain CCMP1594" /NCGR_SAMPLE_ID=MMETSP0809 /ASSEMBLY_ACC=CAM_ASM_000658 /LENGTH=301 /DNA_ID=CAMNT_0015379243 /DNA_START=1 /DNA_END=904 /DNA_ORIENTATION=+
MCQRGQPMGQWAWASDAVGRPICQQQSARTTAPHVPLTRGCHGRYQSSKGRRPHLRSVATCARYHAPMASRTRRWGPRHGSKTVAPPSHTKKNHDERRGTRNDVPHGPPGRYYGNAPTRQKDEMAIARRQCAEGLPAAAAPSPDQAPLRSVARAKNAARAQHGTGPWPRSVVERGSVMGQRGASERHASTRHGTDISKAASGRVWASGGEGEGAGCGAGGEVSVWFGQHPARGPTVSRCLKASGMGHTEALFPELPLSPGDYRHVVPMRRDALTQRLVRPGNRNCDLSRALRLSNRWTNHS